jgi:hypothetical protein
MFLLNLPLDQIIDIMTYLNQKDTLNYIILSKNIHKMCTSNGYIKNMKIDPNTNMMDFIYKYIKHSKTIKKITSLEIHDAHINNYWI